jgi:hypothetical protein
MLNKDNYIQEFKKIHGDRYDYSLCEYKNTTNKIKIICVIHGIFEQMPKMHYRGQGCSKCYKDSLKLTKEKFVEKASLVHKNKYNYSDSIYINSRSKLDINCPIHGTFNIQANNHLNGQGCRKCAGNEKNTEKFIEESIKIHNNKYDYSKVNYINSNTKIIILCPIHGEFEQKPCVHTSGSGCMKCGTDSKRNNLFTFIEKSKLIHGELYDYSLVNYLNNYTKVKIICKIHGEFEQKPNIHLSGCGCTICFGTKTYDNQEFIEKAKLIHGELYDYSLVNYVNNYTKVKIICNKHGIFEQIPNSHLSYSVLIVKNLLVKLK